jgi:hypothetical protein
MAYSDWAILFLISLDLWAPVYIQAVFNAI